MLIWLCLCPSSLNSFCPLWHDSGVSGSRCWLSSHLPAGRVHSFAGMGLTNLGFHKTCRILISCGIFPLSCTTVAEVNEQTRKSVRWTGQVRQPGPSLKLCLPCLFKIDPFLPGTPELLAGCWSPASLASSAFLGLTGKVSLFLARKGCLAGKSLLFVTKGRQLLTAARHLSSS